MIGLWQLSPTVMAGLDPAIHVLLYRNEGLLYRNEGVDGRHKASHDGGEA
jgi:hypothetical protein